MAAYFLQRLLYGFTVLFGVVTLVFFLFNMKPGDPARMLGGQFADESTLQNIRRDLGLDLPVFQRYLLYLNDLSPISRYQTYDKTSPNYLDSTAYSYTTLIQGPRHELVLKWPYLRKSYQSRRLVSSIIGEAIPGTAILAVTAIILAFTIGIVLGVAAAVNQNKFADQVILFFSVIGMSAPSFFVAIIISWLGGYVWSEVFSLPVLPVAVVVFWVTISVFYLKKKDKFSFNALLINIFAAAATGLIIHFVLRFTGFAPVLHVPGTGLSMNGSLYSIDPFLGKILTPENLILPAITLGLRPLAVIVQLTRSSLLEVMEKDYIRTAKAKGLRSNKILYRHALRNALNPVVTAASGWFASLLAGAVFIEFVFGWKGLGLEVFEALEKDDLPVVTGAVLFFSLVFVVINILVDWLYGLLDPRVRIS